jgi:hypothetical protein
VFGFDSEDFSPSVADRPQVVATAWTRRGGRTPAASPPVRSGVASRAPRRHIRLHSHLCLFLSLSPSLGRRNRVAIAALLRRARTHYPPHHRTSNPADSSALNPSTPLVRSTPSAEQSWPGSLGHPLRVLVGALESG